MPPAAKADRAIVVGVARYPRFGSDGVSPNDLQGPVKDARAVADWLTNKARAHVTLITSDGLGEQASGPSPIFGPLRRISPTARNPTVGKSMAEKTARLGRRLYVYMAGHGFIRNHVTSLSSLLMR